MFTDFLWTPESVLFDCMLTGPEIDMTLGLSTMQLFLQNHPNWIFSHSSVRVQCKNIFYEILITILEPPQRPQRGAPISCFCVC